VAPAETLDGVYELDRQPYRLVSRREVPNWSARFVSDSDFRAYLLFPLYRLSAFMNGRMRAAISRRFPIQRMRSKTKRWRAIVGDVFPDRPGGDLTRLAAVYREAATRRFMYYVLERSGRRFRPEFSIEGRESLDQALDENRGVILWAENVMFQTHAGKRALSSAGYPAYQLSTPGHGFSNSRAAKRWLNAWQVAIEDRYLAGWIIFDPHGTEPVGPKIEALLGENKIVLITNNGHAGRRFIDIPIANGSTHRVAMGPISLALKTGAPILPCAVIETAPLQHYVLKIGEALVPETDGNADHAGAVVRAAARYRTWLLAVISDHPEQWMSWQFLRRADDSSQRELSD